MTEIFKEQLDSTIENPRKKSFNKAVITALIFVILSGWLQNCGSSKTKETKKATITNTEWKDSLVDWKDSLSKVDIDRINNINDPDE